MKKFKNITFVFLTVLSILLIPACKEAQQTADLRVTLDESGERTLSPSGSDFEVESYQVVCRNKNGGDAIEITTSRSSFIIYDLTIGTYQITATGKNSSGLDIVRGSTEFSLTNTNTSAVIKLNELIGNGNLNLTFTWDSSLIQDPSIEVSLVPVDGQNQSEISEVLTIQNNSASFVVNDLPTGSYRLTATLLNDGTVVSGCVEAIRIGKDATVNASISFDLDDNPSSVGQIVLENMAGIPVTCVVTGISNESTIQAGQEVEVALETEGIDSEVNIEWYLNGSLIGEGESIAFSPEPGTHRLDVIASTSKLGSAGSTQIRFEAALMGAEGVPVLGGLLTESTISGLSLSSDMILDFLRDGNLMIVDNESKTFQVASIIRNTLNIQNKQSLDFEVDAGVAVAGMDMVALASRNDAKTYVYEYNRSTNKIQNPIDNNGQGDSQEKGYFTQVQALTRNCPIFENSFGIIGRLKTTYEEDRLRNIYSFFCPLATGDDRWVNFTGLNQSFADPYDTLGIGYDGSQVALADSNSGSTVMWATYRDSAKTLYGTISYSDLTAICPLPSSSDSVSRFVVADGDSLRLFEGNKTLQGSSGFTEITEEKILRSEGSGLNTIALILSPLDNYLYALNQGNDTISTYAVSSSGQLTYVGVTELPFTPQSACVSVNGEYMVVTNASGNLIAIMRIKI